MGKSRKYIFKSLGILLVLLLSACDKQENAASNPSVQVDAVAMTYNVRVFSPDDVANGDGWEERKSTVIRLVQKNDPDFVGMQEDLILQIPYIREQLRDYAFVDVSPGNDITKAYNTIYFKKETYKLIRKGRFWLSPTPQVNSTGWDANEPRFCVYGEFEHRNTQKRILVLNTHFDHIGVEARKQSAALVIEKIKELTGNDTTARVIFMGDLNANNTSANGRAVHDTLKTWLYDALGDAPDGLQGPAGTFSGFDGNNEATNRIDFIYHRNLDIQFYRHVDEKRSNGRYPSDHLPVLMKVVF